MALDFPANPTGGQVYGSYTYNATVGAWQGREDSRTVAITSSTAPVTANNGDIWYNTNTGVSYVYYSDGTSSQWVEIVSSAIPSLNTKANIASPTFTGTVVLPSTTSIGNVSSTEIGYVDGVTSAIQTQIDTKAPVASPTFTGTATSPIFASTQATGTAPLTVASTTMVTNLNADMLDGQHGSVYSPSGMISQFAGATAPTGWLLCDGTAISRTTYAALFTTIGTTYGTGNGSTTFNLPNLQGRVPVGRDATQTEFDVLGETGGAKTHTLSVSEMPNHTHQISVGQTTDWNDYFAGGTNPYGIEPTYSGTAYSSPLSSVGGGASHNNLQPYIVINYIIKT